MIIQYDTEKIDDADLFGELLREQFFPEQISGKHYGCYSTFKVADGFNRIILGNEYSMMFCAIHGVTREEFVYEVENDPDTYRSMSDIEHTNIFLRGDGCMVGWHWEGDGTLVVSDGKRIAVNDDCKKSYGWKWYEQTAR